MGGKGFRPTLAAPALILWFGPTWLRMSTSLPTATLRAFGTIADAGNARKAPLKQPRVQAHIISACNEYRQETLVLERSARFGGYAFHVVGLGLPFKGLAQKLGMYDEALQRLVGTVIAADEPVMLADAWDTVILGPASEFRKKLQQLGLMTSAGGVICAGDRICAPEYKMAVKMEQLYPCADFPWQYPNSGGIAGSAAGVRDFLHCLVHEDDGGGYPYRPDGDDQLRIQHFLLARAAQGHDYPFAIDRRCSIFQCMGEPQCCWDMVANWVPSRAARDPPGDSGRGSPRIRNRITGEWPILVHGCGGHGRWFLADIYRELQLLDHFKVRQAEMQDMKFAGLVPPGAQVSEEHWVNQAPWDYPFQLFHAIRAQTLRDEKDYS